MIDSPRNAKMFDIGQDETKEKLTMLHCYIATLPHSVLEILVFEVLESFMKCNSRVKSLNRKNKENMIHLESN